MSSHEAHNFYIVSEVVDGRKAETRLPEEQARKLFKKIKEVNDTASIAKEALEQVEKPFINGFEVEA